METLAQRVRARYPGVYDDIPDAELDRKVRAKYPGVYDDIPSSGNKSEEVSAQLRKPAGERFIEGFAETASPAAILGGLGQMVAHPIDTAASIVGSHVKELAGAGYYATEGKKPMRALGHLLAAGLPVVGPMIADSAERADLSGDTAKGFGEIAGTALATLALGKAGKAVPETRAGQAVARAVSRPVETLRGAASKGKGLASRVGESLAVLGGRKVGIPGGVTRAGIEIGKEILSRRSAAESEAAVTARLEALEKSLTERMQALESAKQAEPRAEAPAVAAEAPRPAVEASRGPRERWPKEIADYSPDRLREIVKPELFNREQPKYQISDLEVDHESAKQAEPRAEAPAVAADAPDQPLEHLIPARRKHFRPLGRELADYSPDRLREIVKPELFNKHAREQPKYQISDLEVDQALAKMGEPAARQRLAARAAAETSGLFNAKTGEALKLSPEEAKAAVDAQPWNREKAARRNPLGEPEKSAAIAEKGKGPNASAVADQINAKIRDLVKSEPFVNKFTISQKVAKEFDGVSRALARRFVDKLFRDEGIKETKPPARGFPGTEELN